MGFGLRQIAQGYWTVNQGQNSDDKFYFKNLMILCIMRFFLNSKKLSNLNYGEKNEVFLQILQKRNALIRLNYKLATF